MHFTLVQLGKRPGQQTVCQAPQECLLELRQSLCASLSSFSAPAPIVRGMMRVVERIEDVWKARRVFRERAQERTRERIGSGRCLHAVDSNRC